MPFVDRFNKDQRAAAVESITAEHKLSKELYGIPEFDPCLVMYWGTMGSGKSLAGCEFTAQSYANGVPVFHNNALDFGEPLDVDRLRRLGYEDCVILIDEIEEYLNSLRSNSNLQLDLIGSLIAIRHNGVCVITTGQYEDEINYRAVRRAKYSIECEMVDENSVRQHVTYKPHQRGERRSTLIHRDMQKYMKLYQTRRRYVVGEVRMSAARANAKRDAELTAAIVMILEGCAENDIAEVTSVEVQLALSEKFGIQGTLQKIGRRLTQIGCESHHSKGGNKWTLPTDMIASAQAVLS